MLYALLFGMVFTFLADNKNCLPGVELATRAVLRVWVAFQRARITLAQVAALGIQIVLMVVVAMACTIGFGWVLARRLRLGDDQSLLSGGAVAICGPSAALAISSVLPRHSDAERNLILTVVGVTTLSTTAMVAYLLIANALGMSAHTAAVFLGTPPHDVTQIVGAGYLVSTETGDTPTTVKLPRVALLVPVVFAFAILMGRRGSDSGGIKAPLLSGFLVGFVVLAVANSFGRVPEIARHTLADLSPSAGAATI